MAVVETVRGPLELSDLGSTLMHEHVFVISTEHVQNYGSDWWDEEARVLLGMDRFGLDLFNPTAERIKTIAIMAARGYAGSMVLSHDANCFIDYWGGLHDTMRPQALPNWHYEHISDDVLPALLAQGVSQAQIDTMMIENPVRYFTTGGAA